METLSEPDLCRLGCISYKICCCLVFAYFGSRAYDWLL